jgi:hypothetical protein
MSGTLQYAAEHAVEDMQAQFERVAEASDSAAAGSTAAAAALAAITDMVEPALVCLTDTLLAPPELRAAAKHKIVAALALAHDVIDSAYANVATVVGADDAPAPAKKARHDPPVARRVRLKASGTNQQAGAVMSGGAADPIACAAAFKQLSTHAQYHLPLQLYDFLRLHEPGDALATDLPARASLIGDDATGREAFIASRVTRWHNTMYFTGRQDLVGGEHGFILKGLLPAPVHDSQDWKTLKRLSANFTKVALCLNVLLCNFH